MTPGAPSGVPPMTTPETPVQGRESAREFVHAEMLRGGWLHCPGEPHAPVCNVMTAAVEDRDRARDAAAEARERVYREALESHAFAESDDGNGYNPEACGTCWRYSEWCDERVAQKLMKCKGHDARRALAAVEALKQGGL